VRACVRVCAHADVAACSGAILLSAYRRVLSRNRACGGYPPRPFRDARADVSKPRSAIISYASAVLSRKIKISRLLRYNYSPRDVPWIWISMKDETSSNNSAFGTPRNLSRESDDPRARHSAVQNSRAKPELHPEFSTTDEA